MTTKTEENPTGAQAEQQEFRVPEIIGVEVSYVNGDKQWIDMNHALALAWTDKPLTAKPAGCPVAQGVRLPVTRAPKPSDESRASCVWIYNNQSGKWECVSSRK